MGVRAGALAGAALLWASSASAQFVLDDVVQLSSPTCMATCGAQVVNVPDGIINGGYSATNALPNATYDFRGSEVRNSDTPTRVFRGNNTCVLGGKHINTLPRNQMYLVSKLQNPGSGIGLQDPEGPVTVERAFIDNTHDSINPGGGWFANAPLITVRGTYIKWGRDDGISDDSGRPLLIEDSLIESHMGISLRPGASGQQSGVNFGTIPVTIRHSLIKAECQPDDRPDGSKDRNATLAANNACGPSLSVAKIWKLSSASARAVYTISDTIFYQEEKPREGWGSDTWPTGTYDNVLLIWGGDGPYQGHKPASVTLSTDVSIWNTARTEWLEVHGCDVTASECDFRN